MQHSINEKYFPQYKEARIGNNENLEALGFGCRYLSVGLQILKFVVD